MVAVNVHLTVPQPGTLTRAPAKGLLVISLYHRDVENDAFLLTPGFTQPLINGVATLQLTPSKSGNAWVVEERVTGGRTRFIRVPDTSNTVNYSDLPDISPTTLDPYPSLTAAWALFDSRITTLENRPIGGGGGSAGTQVTYTTAAGTWTATHTLGRRPNVEVYTLAGVRVFADVSATNTDVSVTFATPTTGYLILS